MNKYILKRTEREILESWKFKDKVYISIVCITYNHGDLIYDALNSFLSQSTNYKFEIIVHDDCSSDQTVNILNEYHKKFPNIIKPIYQSENQYSIAPSLPLFNCFAMVQGEYIALCEGDDYWTDVTKLEKQIKVMIENQSINLAVHDASCISFDNKKASYSFSKHSKIPSIIPFEIISKIEYQFSPTASMFFRSSEIKKIPDSFKHSPCMDLFLEVFLGLNGIYYHPDVMSVYRINVPGSFFERNNNDRLNQICFMEKVISYTEMLKDFIPIDKYKVISNKLNFFHKGLAVNKCLADFKRSEIIFHWKKSITINRKFDIRDFALLLVYIGLSPRFIQKIYHKSKV
ncbi:glycosyltransferase [Enterobacter roggenkampii]|uniref:glycosyltransferase n=1 Tax=Enterobacter roggenkampii TaxID=1812935 RepID=UPI001C702A8A|nr:glycosyltransferase [Enterobacter roggenkampii]MBW9393712.1 glycosyltransferase [Enterobacter roggenkampii]